MPNTIAENLQRLKASRTAIGNAIIAKGGTVNAGDGLEEFPNDINTIPTANLTTLNVTENGTYYESTPTEITSTSFPIALNDSVGTPLLDYLISGNMSQSGTPTPQNPVMPNGTGDMSGNLLEDVITGANIAANGSIAITPEYNIWIAKVTAGETYRASNVNGTYGFYTEKPTTSSVTYNSSRELFSGDSPTIEVPQGVSYIGIRATSTANNVMLNLGSTALPYEPYGYKISISSGGENLINPDKLEQGYLNTFGSVSSPSSTYLERTSEFIPVTGTNYSWTLSEDWGSRSGWLARCFYNESKEMIGTRMGGIVTEPSGSFAVPSTAVYVRIAWRSYGTIECMLNLGATALPYEPYVQPTLSNIYLGGVETTRRIKKLVLTGKENWNASSTYTGSCYAYLTNVAPDAQLYSPIVCTHVDNQPGAYQYGNGRIDYNALSLWLFDSAVTADNFKSYLAQQYAAGTPVTVWYVLATPQTAVVNEPLRKIGDYADTLSMEQAGVQIPTIEGQNTIDVLTELKPSEMYIKYDQSSEYAGYNIVNVNVQTSFTPSDEGKVVSNGALVAQTPMSQDITQNGTYDTTLNDSITVNVSGGAVMPDRYLTVDQLNENNEPKKISIYGAPGDVFNWFFTGSSGTANSFGEVEEIVLDEDFASIGQTYTFRNCDKLTTINLPSQITDIPAYTFVGCSSLVSGFDLTNIETIGQYAFSECGSLDINADLSKVATIPTNAFSFCENLTTVKITNLTTSIGSRAFYDCKKMNGDIDLSNVTNLADASFQHCNSIDKPLNVSKVKTIEGYTFDGCKKVPSITLKADFVLYSSSAKRAFAGCESLTSIQQPTTWPSNTVPEGTYSGCINLEQSFDLIGATSIGAEAFMNCKKMLNPTVGTISTLGTRAFSGCSSITEFNFNTGSTVKTISDEAFKDCTSLALITFAQDSQITSFNKYAFANTKITSMTPPATLNAIGERCFEDCADLVEVDLSGTVYNPGNYQLNSYIFHNCINLTTVKFPATLEAQIGSYNFSNCPKLLSINCPNGIKRLAQYAFAESSIETIPQLTTAVTTLPNGCFKDSGLKNAVIPDQIATIQSYCFAGCTKLTSVTFHEAKNITLASNMFGGCTTLDEIVIPSNVTIPADTFTQGDYEGGVKKVYVKGTSASKLNQYSFRGNTSITDVYFQWSQPSGTQSRYGLRAEATIHYDWDPDAV